MLANLVGVSAFQAHPGLRAQQEARTWGPYPGEERPVAVGYAIKELAASLRIARHGLSTGNYRTSVVGLESALDSLFQLAIHDERPDIIAPLHTMLPEGNRVQLLARLAFSYAELIDDEDGQRRVQRYLDLLIDELPDPTADEPTTTEQRFLRMFAHIYMGRSLDRSRTLQEAIKQLETALEINDLHHDGIEQPRLEAHAALIGLMLKRAFKLSTENKWVRLGKCVDRAIALRGQLEERMAGYVDAHRERLIEIRLGLARGLWHLGFTGQAYRELHGVQHIYDDGAGRAAFDELIAASNLSKRKARALAQRFIDDTGKLRDPDALPPRSPLGRAGDWVALTLRNARHASSLDAVGSWLIGSTAAAGAGFLATRGAAAPVELMMLSGTGALAVDAGRRILNGATAPQTKHAAALGINNDNARRTAMNALSFSAKVLAPAALFGLPLPFVGAAEHMPLVGGVVQAAPHAPLSAGSLHGPGSMVAGAFSAFSGEGSNVDTAFTSTVSAALNYYGGAATNWWQAIAHADAAQLALGSYGAASVGSLVAYNLSDSFRAAVDTNPTLTRMKRLAYPGLALAGYTLADTINSNPFRAHGAVDAALKTYAASALGYFLGYRFSPRFRAAVNDVPALRALGPALVPGGFLAGANLGVALGADPGNYEVGGVTLPVNSIINAFTGSAFSVLGQTLIGNKKAHNLQWGHVIGASLIINGYIGVSANFSPAHQSHGIEMVAESAGRQVGMLPMIVIHGASQMVDARRFAENKLARLAFFDHFGNVTRIALGAWDGALPVIIGTSINFGITNAVLGRMYNDGAGSKPIRLNYANMLRAADGVADEKILKGLARGLRRIPASAPITKMRTETLTLPFRAFVDSLRGKKLARYMIPEQKTYRMLHEMLMDESPRDGLNGTQVQTLLSATEKFLARPDDADIQRGLMRILAAAQHGPHGEQIRGFIYHNRDVRARLRVELDAEKAQLPEGAREKERILWQDLQHPYRVAPDMNDVMPHAANLIHAVHAQPLIQAPLIAHLSARPLI